MVSIIIPCLNGEKYIDRCLESVLNQTYKNIEVIFMNDGSIDNTDKIVKKYKDKRLKYYSNKENLGIGHSRNFGIRKASGEYIAFLDVDDYLDKDAIKEMVNKMEEERLDMLISDYFTNCEYTKIVDFENTTLKEIPRLLLDINLAPWNKMYKKTLIKDIKFIEEGNPKYEDIPFVINALIRSKKIGKLNYPTHYYTVNFDSQTLTRDKRMFDIFKIIDILKEDIKPYKYLKKEFKELAIRIICNYNIQQRYQKDKNIRHEFIDKGFEYMKEIDPNYKNSNYFKMRDRKKAFIEKKQIFK